MFFSLRSNHKWIFMTGMPSKLSSWQKNGIVDHFAGISRLNTSTGSADTYSSAFRISPPRSRRCFTSPDSSKTISSTMAPNRTWPPRASMCSFIGLHKRSGWFPSKKAVWLPSVSLMNRFMAVSTTVMDSLSGSMKSSAFAIGMKTSSMIRSGIPYFRQNSVTEHSSWASIKLCPSISMGSKGGPVWSFLGCTKAMETTSCDNSIVYSRCGDELIPWHRLGHQRLYWPLSMEIPCQLATPVLVPQGSRQIKDCSYSNYQAPTALTWLKRLKNVKKVKQRSSINWYIQKKKTLYRCIHPKRSTGDNIFWFKRIAAAIFSGAGHPGNSKVVNSPGSSCIAKVIWCRFHWRRSCSGSYPGPPSFKVRISLKHRASSCGML